MGSYIQEFIKQCEGNPALSDLVEELKKIKMKEVRTPEGLVPVFDIDSVDALGEKYFITEKDPKNPDKTITKINPKSRIDQIKFPPDQIDKIADAIDKATKRFTKELDDLMVQIDALNKSKIQIEDYKKRIDQIDHAIDAIKDTLSIWDNSLPDDFYNIIINKYMPRQEKFLMALARFLQVANIGAKGAIAMMSALTGWGNISASDYQFDKDLDFDKKPMSADEKAQIAERAKKKADKEIGDINKKIADAKAAMKEVDKQKADVESKDKKDETDPDIKKSLQDRLKELNEEKGDLEAAAGKGDSPGGYLQNAKNNLQQASDVLGKKPPDFPSKELLQKITDGERIIVNGVPGDPKAVPPIVHVKSLSELYQVVSADVTRWTTLSEVKQINLQMTMTTMQQQWTIVTTCMQSLHQMYMTCASSIFR